MVSPRRSAREVARLYEIAAVLARHGFASVVKALGLRSVFRRLSRRPRGDAGVDLAELSLPARGRRVLEQLGPTFVKLGQVLSTRVDLFPTEWIEELQRLQRHAPTLDYASLRPQLIEDLGAPPEELFAEIEQQPYAAASIAQTHRALTKTGERVILKVRRPGIERVIESDLGLLRHLATLAEARVPDARRYQPVAVVRQFSASLRRELDFTIEARSAARMRSLLPPDSVIYVPRVHEQWTRRRLLVQEFVAGTPGHDVAAATAAGLDTGHMARSVAREIFRMILVDGFFHADPHGGNVVYLPDNHVALLDFGMVGYLSRVRRAELVDLLAALVAEDSERVADVLLRWSSAEEERPAAVRGSARHRELVEAIEVLAESTFRVGLRDINPATFFVEVARLMRDHELGLPPNFVLMIKALATLEGLGAQLAPDFDFGAEIKPVVREALGRRYSAATLGKRTWRAGSDIVDVLADLPADVRALRDSLRRGEFAHRLRIDDLWAFTARLDRVPSRVAVSFVTSAFIVGAALVVAAGTGPEVFGLRLFDVLGIGAAAGGVWVLVSIWRGRRSR